MFSKVKGKHAKNTPICLCLPHYGYMAQEGKPQSLAARLYRSDPILVGEPQECAKHFQDRVTIVGVGGACETESLLVD